MINTATIANGCFWCTEAIFQQLKGVKNVTPGFSGGTRKNPTSDQVYSGVSGHAESIQIEFDPEIISFETILDVFWHTHNPTTLNQQGYDKGKQYRSAIFYHDEGQRKIAENSMHEFEKEGLYSDPIVTEIVAFKNFYPAENYHQNFYKNNPNQPYCKFIIEPKLEKFWGRYNKIIETH